MVVYYHHLCSGSIGQNTQVKFFIICHHRLISHSHNKYIVQKIMKILNFFITFGIWITFGTSKTIIPGRNWIHTYKTPPSTKDFLALLGQGFPGILGKCNAAIPADFKCPPGSGQKPFLFPRRACYNLKAGRKFPEFTEITNACTVPGRQPVSCQKFSVKIIIKK